MSLSRYDAELILRRYLVLDASPVVAVLLSAERMAKVPGRLSLTGTELVLTPESPDVEPLSFRLDSVRFEYGDAPKGSEAEVAAIKERFEGVLSIISSSGDRLYIFEPKTR